MYVSCNQRLSTYVLSYIVLSMMSVQVREGHAYAMGHDSGATTSDI